MLAALLHELVTPQCALMLNGNEIQRITAVTILNLSRQDGCVLACVGHWSPMKGLKPQRLKDALVPGLARRGSTPDHRSGQCTGTRRHARAGARLVVWGIPGCPPKSTRLRSAPSGGRRDVAPGGGQSLAAEVAEDLRDCFEPLHRRRQQDGV